MPLCLLQPQKNDRMKRIYLLLAGIVCMGACCAFGQTVTVPFTSDRWNKEGAKSTIETFLGKECILLSSGSIFINDLVLQDGVIETDISFPQRRGFPGVAFRMVDKKNLEDFYVRPHQSGNPDATQYTPVFNNQSGWQLYHGEGYSKAMPFTFEQWHHIKIDVHGRQAEIYIDDMQKPLIKVTELKRDPQGGTIGLRGGGIPVRFANLQYTIRQPVTQAVLPVPANGTDGLITKWQVSNPVNRNLFEDKKQLTAAFRSAFDWTTRSSESSGTMNLSKFTQPKDSGNAMVAKLIIESAVDQVKAISFGFSEYVLVYLNDNALFAGKDNFMSRDYRFLGTIGYFDTLFLPLKKGVNELWFVVGKEFGGWGLQAKLEDMNRISLR
jgi:hypothetical protein